MLTVYFGNDPALVRATVKKEVLLKLPSNTEVVTIESEDYQVGQVTEVIGSASLFATRYCYMFIQPSMNAEFTAELHAHLEDLLASEHQCVVLESTLTAAQKKQFAKHDIMCLDHSVAVPKRANAFGMTDYLCQRNKRKLWLELQTLYREGLAPEEIIGTLWWQLKTIRLAAMTNTATEAGMKDYPYKKAKQAVQAFSATELVTISHTLLAVYHDGHSGARDIRLALEEWVLTL